MTGLTGLLTQVGVLLSELMKNHNEHDRTRYLDGYHKRLSRISFCENLRYPDYNSDDLQLAVQDLENYLEAYPNEINKPISNAIINPI
jgi:hypothetical protein